MLLARALRPLTIRVPIRGTLRLAYLVVGRRAYTVSDDTIVDAGRYRAMIGFHNPPEVQLFFHGVYEPDLRAALEAFLRPGDTAVDVGCNCGVVTLEMASRVGPTGRVIAVDPSPAAAARTRQQASLNGFAFVDVRQAAIEREASGDVAYYQSIVGIGALPDGERRYTTGVQVHVATATLDQVLADPAAARVDLLKIDTDGHEMAVLLGSRRALAGRPLLAMEITPEAMRRNGDDPAALFELLDDLGYAYLVPRSCLWWRYSRHQPAESATLLASGYEGNLVAYRPDDPRHFEVATVLTRGRVKRYLEG
jgi:FkbM family methyltransferase